MSTDRWSDLKPRVLSAIVMLAVAVAAIWAGGVVFVALAMAVCGGMMWELARMTRGQSADWSLALGLAAGLGLGLSVWLFSEDQPGLAILPLIIPVLVGVAGPRRDRLIFAAYGALIMACGLALVILRLPGIDLVIWLVAVIVVSDVMGYFAGRILGGPKFWPSISPKKTWSGTVAGWIGAGLVGLGFYAAGGASFSVIWVSPLVALAGQMGDIAESAIKRRAGVKDSSNLIPGHGGLMDRFDALATGSLVAVLAAAYWAVGG